MMELSLHILDITENAVRAKARHVLISITEDRTNDHLTLEICDDGTGMTTAELKRVLDPFYTTKKVRRVGLGVPMLAQAAENAGGSFEIESEPGKGTVITVAFQLTHVDRQPLGDLAGTLVTLITGNPEVHFVYRHRGNGQTYTLDTHEIKKEIEDVPINHIEILKWIRLDVETGLKKINAQS
ncbi:MAG: sensor histidine kinase [Desulfobacterales bacterium]|nr:sensor histidine kinase [Desulfobacterales bacterium]